MLMSKTPSCAINVTSIISFNPDNCFNKGEDITRNSEMRNEN